MAVFLLYVIFATAGFRGARVLLSRQQHKQYLSAISITIATTTTTTTTTTTATTTLLPNHDDDDDAAGGGI